VSVCAFPLLLLAVRRDGRISPSLALSLYRTRSLPLCQNEILKEAIVKRKRTHGREKWISFCPHSIRSSSDMCCRRCVQNESVCGGGGRELAGDCVWERKEQTKSTRNLSR
jgi:hypothetical protein